MNSAAGTGVLTTRTSVAAVTSLVFGIMSPIVLVTVLATLVTSLMAIVLGHVALVAIRNSGGSVLGRGRAIVGLVLGYIFLPISLWMTPGYFRMPAPTILPPEMRNMSDAEDKLRAKTGELTYGNSPAAKRLAQEFSEQLSGVINESIVRQENSGDLKELDHTLPVFCQLGEDQVCFLVKVPQYHKYEKSARQFLKSAAWRTGVSVAGDSKLRAESRMAIGLKGRILYGNVTIGSVGLHRFRKNDASSRELREFFK